MKYLIVLLALGLITINSCKKDKMQTPISQVSIPFTGIWERNFIPGPGNLHTATYSIYQDSIRYVLNGSIGQANYVLHRDTFLLNENRFIGHTNANLYYLILVKNITPDSISLYKQLVTSINNGIPINIPSDTATQNHGWSTYHKK